MDKSNFKKLLEKCIDRHADLFLNSPEWIDRLRRDGPLLFEELFHVYRDRPDFAFHAEELILRLKQAFDERSGDLKEKDLRTRGSSPWYLRQDQIGAVCYVDRFAKTFRGIQKRIPYLKELGVTYLHLMPFFLSPEEENDGGYAVSDYRECNPNLGTMKELEELARELERNGIALVADFVFNHTSNQHSWARAALSGDLKYQNYYWTFSTQEETEAYQRTLRDIFPEVRKGSFTWIEEIRKWVWTSFHSYQWDLNYSNPEVFTAMAIEMISLANRGISVLRLDAVAFLWKQIGTSSENLEQTHRLIRAFQAVVRIVCPSLVFKSEAIVHPDEIKKYIDVHECQLSYNPLLMAELWEACATKEVRLLAHSLKKRAEITSGCAWVNYVRCHDDIGWTFADEDAAELGINGYDHRRFLNEFYTGRFPGTFAKGLPFQENPETGDCRISGSTASLAGVERALESQDRAALETAIRRVKTLHAVIYSAGGIPLLYLGDEVAQLNDYSYRNNPQWAYDSRWVHRPTWNETAWKNRLDATTVEGSVFQTLVHFARIRKQNPAFASSDLRVLDSGHPSVLAFEKHGPSDRLVVLANFSEHEVELEGESFASIVGTSTLKDPLSEKLYDRTSAVLLKSCDFLWLLNSKD